MKPCFFELKAALSVFMLSVCLLACWYWQQKVTHLAGMDGWLCVCVFVCPCVCLCARACMGSWLTFRLAVLLSLDYLAAAGTLAYLLSGHLCGQARPLCPIQTLVLLTHVRTDAHTHASTHTPAFFGGTATTVTFSVPSSFGTSFRFPPSVLPLPLWHGSKISRGGSRASFYYLYIWCHIGVFVMISLMLNTSSPKPTMF